MGGSMMKRFIKQFISRAGYKIIPTWRLEGIHFANHLKNIFKDLNILHVLDVGANKGQYRDFLRMEVGYTGKIYSFEPAFDTFKFIENRAKSDDKWDVFNCALGEVDGKQTINIMESSSLTSFLKPTSEHVALKHNKIENTQVVQIHKLDSIGHKTIPDWKEGDGIYLKLDTQGYDLNVCKGGSKFLEDVVALQSEMSIIPIYHGMPTYQDTLAHLNSLGYSISNLFPVKVDNNHRLVEFDCIMVRNKKNQ